ncbi:hypothetical protein BH10ACI1_BH10ACI1_19000 [soil metagenome]
MKNLQAFIIGLFTILLFGATTANAATWTVTKAANGNDNVCDADCSLREAVFNADSGDTVNFNPNLVGQTFTLGGSEIVITKRIIIDGYINDPNVAFISGENTSRIFLIEAGAGLELKNAILVQGNPATSTFDAGRGSAISAKQSSSLSLDRVAIRGNTANVAAVIVRTGTHHIINSSFSGNSGNTCAAIYNQDSDANLYVANVTFTGNFDPVQDQFGAGAICNSGNLQLRQTTIANNTAEVSGGGIFSTGGSINLGNTIVAKNMADSAPDIQVFNTTITSVGGNLIGNTDNLPANTFNQPNDITGVNPLLAPTNANQSGHPVVTHPLQAGSPARNGGLNQNAVDPLTSQPLTTDARGAGFPRIAAATVDIGAFEDQSGNTSLIVTKLSNSNDLVCDTDCSLREAVHTAGLNFGTDTITFAANVFGTLSTGGTEILIQNQNVNIVGFTNLTAETLIVSGGDANRIFHLNNATANITGMTMANGDAGAGFGGAILSENNSNLTLNKTIVRNNTAAAYGAIFLSGGTGHITNTTINTNSANTGLAIGNSGVLNMANTTVSSNLDADGGTGIGAIYNTGTLNIRNSTIAFNRTSGGTGGGIFNGGTLNIGNSIVSNNIALVSPDIEQSSGTITSIGGNLVQNTSGFPIGTFSQTNDQTGVDPLLAALTNNGGSVTTHLLMPNSPALDFAINANAVDPFNNSILTTDARGGGYDRIVNGMVDKGAFESLIPSAATVNVGGRVSVGKSGLRNATVILTDTQGISRTAKTGSFGYYQFEEVEVGETYTIQVISKRFQFASQVVFIADEISELNFIADE